MHLIGASILVRYFWPQVFNIGVRMIASMLTAVAAGYAVIAGLLYLYQDQLVYFPERALTATPAQAGLAYEPVRFTSADGVALSGWFIPVPEGPRHAAFLPWQCRQYLASPGIHPPVSSTRA